jgi:hypothetical protein
MGGYGGAQQGGYQQQGANMSVPVHHTSVLVTGATYCCVEKGAGGGSNHIRPLNTLSYWEVRKNYRNFFICYYLDIQMHGKRWQSLRRFSSIQGFIRQVRRIGTDEMIAKLLTWSLSVSLSLLWCQLRRMKLCTKSFTFGAPSFPGKRVPGLEAVNARVRQLNTYLVSLFTMRPELSQNQYVVTYLQGSDVGGGALLGNDNNSPALDRQNSGISTAGGQNGMPGQGQILPPPPAFPGGVSRFGEVITSSRNEMLVQVLVTIPMKNMQADEMQAGAALAIHMIEQLVEISHASQCLLDYRTLQLMTLEGTCSDQLKASTVAALRDPQHGLGTSNGQAVIGTQASNPYLDLCRRIRQHDVDQDGMVSQWDLGQVIAKLHLSQFKAQKVPSLVQQCLVRATSAGAMMNGGANNAAPVGIMANVDYYAFVQLMQQHGLLGSATGGGGEVDDMSVAGDYDDYHSKVDVVGDQEGDQVRDGGTQNMRLMLKGKGQRIPGYFSTGPDGHSKTPPARHEDTRLSRRGSALTLGQQGNGENVRENAEDVLTTEQWNQFSQQLRQGFEVIKHFRRRKKAGLSHGMYLTAGKRVIKATDQTLTKLRVCAVVLKTTFDLSRVTQVKSVGLNSYYSHNFMWDPRKADR